MQYKDRERLLRKYPPKALDSSSLPYKVQYLLLENVQRVLAGICHYFTQQHLPNLLESNDPLRLELHKWWRNFKHHALPAGAVNEEGGQTLAELVGRLVTIQQLIKHREPGIPITYLEKMLLDAIAVAKALRDEARGAELLQWHNLLSGLMPSNYDVPRAQPDLADELDDIHGKITALESEIVRLKRQPFEEKAKEKACAFKLVRSSFRCDLPGRRTLKQC